MRRDAFVTADGADPLPPVTAAAPGAMTVGKMELSAAIKRVKLLQKTEGKLEGLPTSPRGLRTEVGDGVGGEEADAPGGKNVSDPASPGMDRVSQIAAAAAAEEAGDQNGDQHGDEAGVVARGT